MIDSSRIGCAVYIPGIVSRTFEPFVVVRGRAEPLAMYGMTLRQVDLLAEYFCLYRICEWADGKNGVSCINDNVDAIATHDFGELRTSLRARSSEPLLHRLRQNDTHSGSH